MKALTLVALLLVGCATKQPVWTKPGSTQQEFNMATGQCRAQALSLYGGMQQKVMVFDACMNGQGWQLTEAH